MKVMKHKNFWVIFAADLMAIVFAYSLAYRLRFDGQIGAETKQILYLTLAPCLVIKICAFSFFDLYRGMWRYTGINDLLNVVKAAMSGSLVFVAYLAMLHHFSGIPRSVLVFDFVLTMFFAGGLRLGVRLYYQREPGFLREFCFWNNAIVESRRVLILGTGTLAEQLLREINSDGQLRMRVIGFVGQDGRHCGMKIHGFPILGEVGDLERLVVFYQIQELLIACDAIESEQMGELIELCVEMQLAVKLVPSLDERLSSGALSQLRPIKVEDLLDREPVSLNMTLVRREIAGRCVMITGAGGSIGSEIARQVIKYNPSELILVDNAETPLYRIDWELQNRGSATTVRPCIGDVRSTRSLERIFRSFVPNVVYHAAAYKHVPMMEMAPLDAVNNNIMGTYKLASLACKYNVAKFVMISTDKAVRPTSVMGTTKRIAEMVVQSLNGGDTKFAVVRFGNVLGSNGSVVPLFEKQIAAGGPVTVTHPDVTRYFMTIPEAVTLVLQSGAICNGGELFLLDMGKPIRIVDLARKMIQLSGLIPDKDIKVEFIGLRPGEKLYEELLIEDEGVLDTAYDKIKICSSSCPLQDDELYSALEKFRLLIESGAEQANCMGLLATLVPSAALVGYNAAGTAVAKSLEQSDLCSLGN